MRRGAGHRAGAEPGGPLASVRAILHDQARRHGHGPLDLPLDYRSPWWAAVGNRVRAAGCSLSVYDPRHRGGRIVIRSMSLFGTFLTNWGGLTTSVDRSKADLAIARVEVRS